MLDDDYHSMDDGYKYVQRPAAKVAAVSSKKYRHYRNRYSGRPLLDRYRIGLLKKYTRTSSGSARYSLLKPCSTLRFLAFCVLATFSRFLLRAAESCLHLDLQSHTTGPIRHLVDLNCWLRELRRRGPLSVSYTAVVGLEL